MNLQTVIYKALEPYKCVLQEWTSPQVESLFLGFGDISIFKADAEDYLPDENISGTHKENALSILSALKDLEIEFNCEVDDLYWIIEGCSGTIREDLKGAIENIGYKCHSYFNPDSIFEEAHTLQDIITFEMQPSL